MKKLSILLLVLVLLLSGCQGQQAPQTTVESPEETAQEPPQEVKKEDPVQIETPTEVETKSEVSVTKPEEKDTGVRIEVTVAEKRYLNAFMDITEIDENLSFVELPNVLGPENLKGFITQKLVEDFYQDAVDHWKKIIKVQDEKQHDNSYEFMTVYQVKTNVFESEDFLLLLARRHMVFGYDDASDDSKVFCINKKTGDFVDVKDQMISQGKTVEEAMETLSVFQKENSDVNPHELSEEVKGKLIQKDVEIQKSLTQTYGSGKTIIINNFSSPEAYEKTEVFLIKEKGKVNLVTKLHYVTLGDVLNDEFLHSYWVKIPADYRQGKLERKRDPANRTDFIYE